MRKPSVFAYDAQFTVGDVTVTLSVDPYKIGVRPEKFPAVAKWVRDTAKVLEAHMKELPGEDLRFIKAKTSGKA